MKRFGTFFSVGVMNFPAAPAQEMAAMVEPRPAFTAATSDPGDDTGWG